MVFRKKKGKGNKPNGSGKRKLKRSIYVLPEEDLHHQLTEDKIVVQREIDGSNTAPHDNEESSSDSHDDAIYESEERCRPMRKCRLSMVSGPAVPAAHDKLEKSNAELTTRGAVECEIGVKEDEENGHPSQCTKIDETVRLTPPVDAIVVGNHSRKGRQCVKSNRNADKIPQVVLSDVNVSVDGKSSSPKESNALLETSDRTFPMEEKKHEELQGSCRVPLSCHDIVSRRLRDSLKLRDLRVIVTRTEFPVNPPNMAPRVRESGKLPEVSEDAGNGIKVASAKQKSKKRGKRVCSVNSESSLEIMDSSESVQNSEVERYVVDAAGKGAVKKTPGSNKKSDSVQGKGRKSFSRVLRRLSDTSDENPNLTEGLSKVNKDHVIRERNAIVDECLTIDNDKANLSHLTNKTALRQTRRVKSSTPEASSSDLSSADLLETGFASFSGETGSPVLLDGGKPMLLTDTCQPVDAQASSSVESDLMSAGEESVRGTVDGRRKSGCTPGKRRKALSRLVRITSDTSDEALPMSEGLTKEVLTGKDQVDTNRSVVSVEHLQEEKQKASPIRLKNKTTIRRTCRVKSSSPGVSSSAFMLVNMVDTGTSTSSKAGICTPFTGVDALSQCDTSNIVGTSVVSNEESDQFSGNDERENLAKRPGNRLRYRIESDSDSDKIVGLPTNAEVISQIRTGKGGQCSVLEKSNEEEPCISVSTTCSDAAIIQGASQERDISGLNCSHVCPDELQKMLKLRETSISTCTKSTQTSFLTMRNDAKVCGNSIQMSVGVQKNTDMTSQETQTKPVAEILWTEGIGTKCQERNLGSFDGNNLPNLMMLMLTQLKSANELCMSSASQEKQNNSGGCVKNISKPDPSEPSGGHNLRTKRFPKRKSEYPSQEVEDSSKSRNMPAGNEKELNAPESSGTTMSSFLLGLDLVEKSSLSKILKSKNDKNISSFVPKLVEVNPIQSNSQVNKMNSIDINSIKSPRKSVSLSRQRKSSGPEKTKSSRKGKLSVTNSVPCREDVHLDSTGDVCVLELPNRTLSQVTQGEGSGKDRSSSFVQCKATAKGDVGVRIDNSKKCVENGISDSSVDGDLHVVWHSKSGEVPRKIKRSKENEITVSVPTDKSIEIIKEVKSPLGHPVPEKDGGNAPELDSGSVEKKSEIDFVKPCHVSEVIVIKDKGKLKGRRRSAPKERSTVTCIPTPRKKIIKGPESKTLPLPKNIGDAKEVGQSSLDDGVNEVLLKTAIDDHCSCDDDDDCDVISIYGESECDQLLTGMYNHHPGTSMDAIEQDKPSFKLQGAIPVLKKTCDVHYSISENVCKSEPSIHVSSQNDSGLDGAIPPKTSDPTLDGGYPVDETRLSPNEICVVKEVYPTDDMRSSHDELASSMDQSDTLHLVDEAPSSISEDANTSDGAEKSYDQNVVAYHDVNENTPSRVPVTQKKYSLKPPEYMTALYGNADALWPKGKTIFKGMCFHFLRRGSGCCCRRFKHKFRPNFMQCIEQMESWDVFVCLVHSLRREFTFFWNEFGVSILSLLACRHEGQYLYGVLFIYCCTKLPTIKWIEVLKCLETCTITDENCVLQILLYLIINHIHKGKVKNRSTYDELVDRVTSICCKFKDTSFLCDILEVLSRQEFWFSKSTFEQLLQRCVAEASTDVGLELCFIFAKFINRLDGLSHAEPSVVLLVKEFIKILELHGDNLAVSIMEKVFQESQPKATIGSDNYSMKVQSESELCVTFEVQGSGGMESWVNRKRPNPNQPGGQPAKKPLLPSPLHTSVGTSCGVAEMIIPEKSTSALTVLPQSLSRCNVAPLQRKDAFCDNFGYNPMFAPSSSFSSLGVNRNAKHYAGEINVTCGRKSVPNPLPSPEMEVQYDVIPVQHVTTDLGTLPPVTSLSYPYGESDAEDQLKKSNEEKEGIFSEEEEKGIEKYDVECYPAQETERQHPGSSSQPTYSEVYRKKYNIPLLPTPKSVNLTGAPSSTLSLAEVVQKKQWTPVLMIKFFSPCLGSTEKEKDIVFQIVSLLEKDMTAAFSVMKAMVTCLASKELMEAINYNKRMLMVKVVNTLVFNVMLKMIICEMWSDAYGLMNVANDASLPLFQAEAYFTKLSQSGKLLFLSEVCFRCDKMKEALHLLRVGNLFYQIPSQWRYGSEDADFETRIAFINSLICKLATGGYSDLAPETYLEVYRFQNGVSESVDLLLHANKVIICAINGGFLNLAYEVYKTVPDDDSVLTFVTLRALLIGMVTEDIEALAKPIYAKMCENGIYPSIKENQLVTEIVIKSFWLKEEIFMILTNFLQVIGPILLVHQPAKYKEPDFCVSLLLKNCPIPDDLNVVLKLDDESEKDPVPYILTLKSDTIEHVLEEVSFVLGKKLVPPIKYTVFTAEEGASKRVVLNKMSLINHLINAEVKSEVYR